MASTENIYTDALTGAGGLSVIPKGQAQRGDLVLYEYTTDPHRRVSHVGIVTSSVNAGRFTTVEGNTGYDPYPVVGTHNVSVGDRHVIAISASRTSRASRRASASTPRRTRASGGS